MNHMLTTLIRRSFIASRMRNLIAVLAITLTAILFTTVTTLTLGARESMTLTMQIQKGSRSDGDFHNMTKEQFDALADADFIKDYGLRMPVAFLTNTHRHNIEFDVMDETEADLTFCAPTHGTFPETANEVVTSDAAIRELGAEPEIGAKIPVTFTAHGREYTFDMSVSGWYEATNSQASMMFAGESFKDAHPDIFTYTFDKDRADAGTYMSDIIATSTRHLEENMKAFVKNVGGDPDNLQAENSLPAVVNTATHQSYSLSVMIMGGCVALLFIFCGYLLIYNVFDIAVMQQIRRYGLYRTIGMSRRQVKTLINRQAVFLSCIGIPLGLVIGYLIGNATLPVIMNMFSGEYKIIAASASPSPIIFLGAAALTALTVAVSTRKPVRTAANIPPIEAFRYVESPAGKEKRCFLPGFRALHASSQEAYGVSLLQLAWSNLGRNKRRSAFILISLALCVVLENSAGIAAASVDVEKMVSYIIRTDYAVVNAVSTNGQKGFTRREQGLTQPILDKINAQPGVTDAAPIYKNTVEDADITYDFGTEFKEIYKDTDAYYDTGLLYGVTKEDYHLGLGDDKLPICNVYGMEETALSRMELQEGETDSHILYEKMEKGEGVLVGVMADRSTMTIDPDFDMISVGDTITVRKDGKALMELPVLSKAAINGDDMEIGYTVNGTFQVGGDGLFLYMPSSLYKNIYDKPTVYKYSFDVEESQREHMTAFLKDTLLAGYPELDYVSADSARKSSETERTIIRFVGGLIGMIFGIAGILNLINTLITTILTRRHEFATMQSIGMTNRQLTKMMVYEGILYAAGGCAIGLLLSILLGFTLIQNLLASMWHFTFHFTLLPALAVCTALLVLGAVIPVIALKLFHKGSIIEKLRVSE